MSIQITLTNPFARFRRPRKLSLIALVNGAAGQLLEFRHDGAVQGGEVLATLLTAGSAVSLVLKKINSELQLIVVIDGVEVKSLPLEDLQPLCALEVVQAHPVVVQTLRVLRQGAARPWSSIRFVVVAAILALILVVAAGWTDGQGSNSWAAATAAVKSETGLAAPVNVPLDMLDAAERKILAKVVAESGIALNPSSKGKPFAVFSDPNCPACRAFEKQLQAMDKSKFMPIVVPVAFKPGSNEAVAGVMCAKNIAAAWATAAGTNSVPSPSCPKGETHVQNNNAAFVALRFHSTPTLVAPNGRVIEGTGTTDQVLRWLGKNS